MDLGHVTPSVSLKELLEMLLITTVQRCFGIFLDLQIFLLGLWVYLLDEVLTVKRIFYTLAPSQSNSLDKLFMRAGITSLPSRRDANAGAVSLLRYVATFHEDITLDPQLRRFESIFLSKINQLNTRIVCSCRPLLNLVVEEQGLFLACRTAVFDEMFSEAIECRGVRQILILGAGYDTRAYRFIKTRRRTHNEDTVKVIEIDRPFVQDRKRRLLRQNLKDENEFLSLTEGVEYVGCDFAVPDALRSVLEKSKIFNPSVPTFILWEGVTYYLDQQAIQNVLATLSSFRSGNTNIRWSIAFDFADERCFTAAAPTIDRVVLLIAKFANQPIVSGLPSDENNLNKLLEGFHIKVLRICHCFEMASKCFPRFKTGKNILKLSIAYCEWM